LYIHNDGKCIEYKTQKEGNKEAERCKDESDKKID